MDQEPIPQTRQGQAQGQGQGQAGGSSGGSGSGGQRNLSDVNQSRVVKRPTRPGEDNPKTRRSNEIRQLRTRYGANFKEDSPETFKVTLKLSEDFPFELEELRLELTVPEDYPKEGFSPSIRVLNSEIPRGHGINIEKGFEKSRTSQSTRLLDMFNSLDKNLEVYLGAEKASTIKIVPNIRNPAVDVTQISSLDAAGDSATGSSSILPEAIEVPKLPPPEDAPEIEPQFSSPERSAAQSRRAAELRQLEARFRQNADFQKIADGVYYVPLQIRKKPQVPMAFQGVRSARLVVPILYPLMPCKIELINASHDGLATTVARNFQKKVQESPGISLMSHLNYLSLNIATLSRDDDEATPAKTAQSVSKAVVTKMVDDTTLSNEVQAKSVAQIQSDEDRPHITRIPRPDQQSQHIESSSSHPNDGDGQEPSDSDSDLSDYEPSLGPEVLVSDEEDEDEGDDNLHEEDNAGAASTAQPTEERGTSISFPGIQLSGIEVLEISVLNITIKCDRCKAIGDINGLKPKIDSKGAQARMKLLGCEKCSSVLGIEFRKELIHEHNSRAGFLDLSGCSVVDILPSDFIPTCAACSTTMAMPVTGVARAQSMHLNCRSCYAKMSLFIPDIKLLKISPDALQIDPSSLRIRKVPEKLGLVSGTPLPERGSCAHYRRKTRWFRFSCCKKVYSCEKCHMATESHPWEHANRMICGMCSREQNFKPDLCRFCGHSFLPKKTGFWEGGKGTRDQTRMSRKDPRKYKRLGGSGH